MPVARIAEGTPGVDMAPDLVDDGRRIVLLFGRRKAFALVEDEGVPDPERSSASSAWGSE